MRTAPKIIKDMTREKAFQSQGYFPANIMADAQHMCEFEEIAFLTWKSGEIPEDVDRALQEVKEGAQFSLDSRRKFFKGIHQEVTGRQTPC